MNKQLLIVLLVTGILACALFVFSSFRGERAAPTMREVKQGEKEVSTLPIVDPSATASTRAMFANGCFWCVEHDLEEVHGVKAVISGYAGGSGENPSYQNYAETGHREVVEVEYDPNQVSYANLVEHIIKHGDPTDNTGSFADRGKQYAPAIYYRDQVEYQQALEVIAKIDALKKLSKPITIEVLSIVKFWPAEDYHQDYAKNNPLRYNYYSSASGRSDFIKKYWGTDAEKFVVTSLPAQLSTATSAIQYMNTNDKVMSSGSAWQSYKKPSADVLKQTLDPLVYSVTQKEGTEPPFDNAYHANKEEGIYVDVLSGEPLFLSSDKYDSGTGWPSFVKPISADAVTFHEDRKLFSVRTEVRSRYADSHLGHVFNDGPKDRGGMRYCMNSAALRFVPKSSMVNEGYGEYVTLLTN